MEQMLLLHVVNAHIPPPDSWFLIGSQKLLFYRRRKCPFDTLAGYQKQTEHEHTHLHHLTLPDTQEMFREDLYCRVWEYIRKLNPGGQGIRYWSRRGGTKLQVRRLKGLILTIGPRSLRVIVNRNHFTTKNLIKTLNRLCFNSITFKREISYVSRKLPWISRRRSIEQVSRRWSSEKFVMVGGRSTVLSS